MKTPEEIKIGIACEVSCMQCPYKGFIPSDEGCDYHVKQDTLAYIEQMEGAMNRMGKFWKLFVDYEGCPRGACGRAAVPIEEEVLLMEQMTDVDGGKWIPVNADALRELVEKYKQLEERIQLMLIQMKGDCGVCKHRTDERKVEDGQLGCRLSPACYECLKKDGRSMWEYEGLPEL